MNDLYNYKIYLSFYDDYKIYLSLISIFFILS